jgi:hypothetical protein
MIVVARSAFTGGVAHFGGQKQEFDIEGKPEKKDK